MFGTRRPSEMKTCVCLEEERTCSLGSALCSLLPWRQIMLDSMVLGVKGLNWYQSNWTADSCFCDMPPTSISRCLAAEDPETCNCIFSQTVMLSTRLMALGRFRDVSPIVLRYRKSCEGKELSAAIWKVFSKEEFMVGD